MRSALRWPGSWGCFKQSPDVTFCHAPRRRSSPVSTGGKRSCTPKNGTSRPAISPRLGRELRPEPRTRSPTRPESGWPPRAPLRKQVLPDSPQIVPGLRRKAVWLHELERTGSQAALARRFRGRRSARFNAFECAAPRVHPAVAANPLNPAGCTARSNLQPPADDELAYESSCLPDSSRMAQW